MISKISYIKMKKTKIYSLIIAVCVFLTSCNAKNVSSSDEQSVPNSSAITESVPETTVPETTVPETTVPETTVPETTVPETTVPETTVPETTIPETTAPETTAPETTVPETTAPETTVPEEPTWNEESIEDSLYITVDCYERLSAYLGAPAGNLLKKGNKVNVIAQTDTNYYKMENGRYVHKDYVSKNKPSEVVQPTGSFEAEINKVKLKPVRTNNKKLDALVDKILAKIIKKDMTNSQKLKAVYDYIIANSTYSGGIFMYQDMIDFCEDAYLSEDDMETVFFAYQILSTGEGVCDNYASAFTVLTRAIGFESYSVGGGVAYSGGGYTGHRWNNIKVGNTWYEFDSQIEDKYNELNGYTSYFFYGNVRHSNPDLYIYPDNENAFVEKYKGFKFAEPLIGDINITAGDYKLDLHYEQQKPNKKLWPNADHTNDSMDYEGTTPPKVTITLNAEGGTLPYYYEFVIIRETGEAIGDYLCDEDIWDSTEKSVSYSLQLPNFGKYTLEYTIQDDSAREIAKEVHLYVYDNSPLKGTLTVEKETREGFVENSNTRAAFSYTGGGMDVTFKEAYAVNKSGDSIDARSIGYYSSTNETKFDAFFILNENEKYEVFLIVEDSNGVEHEFSQKFTYIP